MLLDYKLAALALAGLQNLWMLDEANGSVTAFADSKGGNNGAASTAPGFQTTPDGVGKAVDFNATSGKVILPGSNVTLPDTHTIFYYMYRNDQNGLDAMAVEWATASFAKYMQHDAGYSGTISGHAINTSSLFSAFYGGVAGATAEYEQRADFVTHVWEFVAVTMDAGLNSTDQVDVYMNAVKTGTPNSGSLKQTGSAGAGVFGIGGRGQGGRGLPFGGALCGVGILNRIMTTSEMSTLMAAMTGSGTPTTGQLWPHGRKGTSPTTGQLFPRGVIL